MNSQELLKILETMVKDCHQPRAWFDTLESENNIQNKEAFIMMGRAWLEAHEARLKMAIEVLK